MVVAKIFLSVALVLMVAPTFFYDTLKPSPVYSTAAQTSLELGRNSSSTTELAVDHEAPYYVRVAVESSKSEDSVLFALKSLHLDWRIDGPDGVRQASGSITTDNWSIRSIPDNRRFKQHYWMTADSVALEPGNDCKWTVSVTNVATFLNGDKVWVELQMYPDAADELAKPAVFWFMVSYWSRILGAICAFVGLGLYWWAYRKERKPS
jgi:hypothetical protein